eukprot:10914567-Heterocapsa_arctica.AAC.1
MELKDMPDIINEMESDLRNFNTEQAQDQRTTPRQMELAGRSRIKPDHGRSRGAHGRLVGSRYHGSLADFQSKT